MSNQDTSGAIVKPAEPKSKPDEHVYTIVSATGKVTITAGQSGKKPTILSSK